MQPQAATVLRRQPMVPRTTPAERAKIQERTNLALSKIEPDESKESALLKARQSLAYLNSKSVRGQ